MKLMDVWGVSDSKVKKKKRKIKKAHVKQEIRLLFQALQDPIRQNN